MSERLTAARPPIVCMCGSTRFKQAWIAENARLTGEGQIVLAVGLWGHHERRFPSPEQKAALDELHKRKIDLADWVWVLDLDGYIGDSTRSEIAYAEGLGKPVRYLSREFPGYREPEDPLIADLSTLRERLAALEAEAGALRAALLRLEWVQHCPQCDVLWCPGCRASGESRLGHFPDCFLAAALTPGAGERAGRILAAADAWERACVAVLGMREMTWSERAATEKMLADAIAALLRAVRED